MEYGQDRLDGLSQQATRSYAPIVFPHPYGQNYQTLSGKRGQKAKSLLQFGKTKFKLTNSVWFDFRIFLLNKSMSISFAIAYYV